MHDALNRIGGRFRSLRKKLKYTQEQVAEKSGINSTYYGRVERGEANISLGLLLSIAQTLNVSLADLLRIEPEKDREQMLREVAELLGNASDDELRLFYRLAKDIAG